MSRKEFEDGLKRLDKDGLEKVMAYAEYLLSQQGKRPNESDPEQQGTMQIMGQENTN